MANVDGDVKIRVSLDDRGTEKGIDRIKQKMQGLAKAAGKTFSANARRKDIEDNIDGYREQVRAIEETVRAEKKMYSELKRMREKVEYDPEIREKVDRMGIVDLDAAIAESNTRILEAQKAMDGYKTRIKDSNNAIREMENGTDSAGAAIKKLGDRMNQLARRIFIFNILRRALTAMQEGLTGLLKQDSAVAKSMAQIKGSLYAAFMPIYNYALPAIRALMSFLAQLTSAIANIVGGLFGVSASALANAEALKQQAGATGAAGSAAKKAAKSIAAFDEINQLSENSSAGGGAGGAAGWDFSGLDNVSTKMRNIAKLVLAIGAGIAAWKLTKAFGGLKDATMLGNLKFITGAAITIWAVLDLIVPAVKDIAENGPNLENVLNIMGGIFLALGGISFMTGNVGGGLLWIAAGVAAIAAANWDEIKGKLGDWEGLVGGILSGFTDLAGIITDIATNGLNIDVLGKIGDMGFTTNLTTSAITTKLLNAIGGLLGVKGKIGLAKTSSILLAISTAVDIGMDVIDIINGNAEEKSEAMWSLIKKLLFGTAAAVITIATGGGALALMFTVPIGIKIATEFFEQDAEAEQIYSGEIQNAIKAAESAAELKAIIEGFTNIQMSDSLFDRLVGMNVTEEMKGTAEELKELKEQTEAFAGLFHQKSAEEGFEEWLQSLGLLQEKVQLTDEDIRKFEEGYEKYTASMRAAAEATEDLTTGNAGMSETSKQIDDIAVGMDGLAKSGETLQTDLESVETVLNNVETAAEGVNLELMDGTADAFEAMATGAEDTGNAMTETFALAASRIRKHMSDSLSGVFKSFRSGGSVFKGIESGVSSAFKNIVNGLIDGLNTILNKSFNKINDALDKIRNTQISGTKPFIGVPRVSFSKIPKLAQGAVIPANREFLAILGDQKQGTNIEAPLDTIVEAVMIAMAKAGMDGGNIASAMRTALSGLALKVGKDEIGHVVADAINANRRREGKIALNL